MRPAREPGAGAYVSRPARPEPLCDATRPRGRLKVKPRDLLNALSELLLEKGILTLEEISERVLQVQSRHHSEE